MHELGHTRSRLRPDHLLVSPDSFVRTPLPGLTGAFAIVHAAPALGASFAQYTVEFAPGGGTLASTPGLQRFVYVVEGLLSLERTGGASTLEPGGYVYLPATADFTLHADGSAQAVVIERAARPSNGDAAELLTGHEREAAPVPLLGDPAIEVRSLLPEHPALDFAVNLMTYQPGASLPMVEVHVMEHGLLMLEGGGIYRLGEAWYPVRAGDFLWMGPFCPQWFGALGKSPAKYLIYKDWNQHPISGDTR